MNRSSVRFAAGVVLGLVVGVGLGSLRQVHASQVTMKATKDGVKIDERSPIVLATPANDFTGAMYDLSFYGLDVASPIIARNGTVMLINTYRGEFVLINPEGRMAILRLFGTPKSCVEVERISQAGKRRTTKLYY